MVACQALKLLRVPRIQPYVVLLRPPSLKRLRETRPALCVHVWGGVPCMHVMNILYLSIWHVTSFEVRLELILTFIT